MKSKRTFVSLLVGCLTLFAMPILIAQEAGQVDPAESAPPNIVLILADDLGFGDVGFNGSREIPTPNIDSLARDGARFVNGYSSHPFCSPMRAGLMAGRYQHRFGYVTNVAFDPHNQRMGLPQSETTIAKRLQDAGYQTGMVGKWHLGAAAPFHPLNRGFDFFYGFLGGGHDYFVVDTTAQLRENYKAALDDNGKPVAFDGYLTDVLTDQAIEFVQQANRDEPYFLYVAYNAPHGPLQAPQAKIDEFTSIQNPKRRIYAAMVASMDDQIGRLLAQIDARGQRDNTIVFFLSDNGGPETANASDNGPLRGQKGDLFEGGIHVPFVMRWPARVKASTTVQTPVISIDISRTALQHGGASIDDKIEGLDLISVIQNDSTVSKQIGSQRKLHWRTEKDAQLATRSGNQKWLTVGDQTMVFDLDKDLSETTNLIETDAPHAIDVQQRLTALHQAWSESNQPALFPGYRLYHEKLKAFHKTLQDEARQADGSDGSREQ